MMKILSWLSASFALSCVVIGCGKSEGGSVARDDLAPQLAKIVCGGFAGCCQQQGQPVDASACQAELVARLEDELSSYASTTTYDARAAGRCLAYIRDTARCGIPDDDDVEPACSSVFVGHAKPGQACNDSIDCEKPATGGVYCNHDSASGGSNAPGVCTTEELTVSAHGKLGDSCFSSCDAGECVAGPAPAPGVPEGGTALCYRSDGLYCAAGQCAPLVAAGGACQDSDACAGEDFCSSSGVCTTRQADGAACESDSWCQSGDCKSGVCGAPLPSVEACMSGSPFGGVTD